MPGGVHVSRKLKQFMRDLEVEAARGNPTLATLATVAILARSLGASLRLVSASAKHLPKRRTAPAGTGRRRPARG
jgi:hypothetical protein